MNIRRLCLAATLLMTTSAITGCKSYWIEASVENQTGLQIRELEVAYPSASFGMNNLAAGASMHYRFQVRGSGPIKVDYIASDGKNFHLQGLDLSEQQHGEVIIRLLPGGKSQFVPSIQPSLSKTTP